MNTEKHSVTTSLEFTRALNLAHPHTPSTYDSLVAQVNHQIMQCTLDPQAEIGGYKGREAIIFAGARIAAIRGTQLYMSKDERHEEKFREADTWVKVLSAYQKIKS